MTTKEFRERIAKSKLPQCFNELSVKIDYSYIDFEIELKGLSSIHNFLLKQVEGWQKHDTLPTEFQESLNHFSLQIQNIEKFLENCLEYEDENSILNQWNNYSNLISRNNYYFTFDAPKSVFLLNIHTKQPGYFQGAYSFIVNQNRPVNKQELIGFLLAFEFDSKDTSALANRIDFEKKSIKQLRTDFQNQVNQTESQLTEHLTKSSKDYENYVTTIDKFKEEKEALFDEWFAYAQSNFNKFDQESKSKITELEKIYEEKLKLEKPAKYWQKKSTTYYTQGNNAKTLLYWIVGVACLLLSIILITSPDYIFNAVFDGNKIAIVRWSVVFITLLSLIAFAVRALTKYMFSSFHLARDAEERHTLTFFYLSLLKDTEVKDEDRKLILQSLFSRAETGLLKDESGPTMPNDISSKIMGNR